MLIERNISQIHRIIREARKKRKVIGFVPTMGALHEGHFSLIRAARKECDFVVVSIFVNPIQFGPTEDFKKYPRNFKKDKRLLKLEKVDLIFYPRVKDMYPKDFSTFVEEQFLSKPLCGKSRPGHFKGVCTVVAKLFNIVEPDVAYFGQKDYQQAQIIKRMVEDLNFPIKIKVLPIIRERDGLAMSSRNSYLSFKERKDATILLAALRLARTLINKGERSSRNLRKEIIQIIKSKKSAKIDYVEIVDAHTLRRLTRIKGKVLVALAVYIGKTRLIDNIVVRVRNS